MGPQLTNYLWELQSGLQESFGPEQGSQHLSEVYWHLDADIQARLELGSSPEMVEAEAIAAFGPAQDYVRALKKVNQPNGIYRPFVYACLSIPLSLLLAFLFDGVTGRTMSYGLFVAVLFFVVTSYLSRTVQWKTLVAASALALVYAVGYHAATTVQVDGPISGRVYRSFVADAGVSHMVPRYEAAVSKYRALRAVYGDGKSNLAPVTPTVIPSGKVRLEKTRDARAAAELWRTRGTQYEALLLDCIEQERSWFAAVEASKQTPWWRELPRAAPEALSVASQFLGILWLIHIAAALLGAFTARLNRWYRRLA